MVSMAEAEGVELPLVSHDEEAAQKSQSETAVESKEKRVEYVALAVLMWTLFMQGWNDGSVGPLLPVIQRHYKVGYTVVSLVFVVSGVGFISAAVSNIYLSQKIGFGKVLCIGAILQMAAYAVQAAAPPFPVFLIAIFFCGFGMAIQNPHAMDFCVSLKKHSATKLAFVQAAYGLGALLAPISAIHFAAMPRWSFHYLVSLGGAIINAVFLLFTFKLEQLDVILTSAGQPIREKSQSQDSPFLQLLKLKALYLVALFSLAYVGVEFTLSGWIVTFVLVDRGGGINSGYLSSGFFAGMFVGRIVLLLLNKAVGERRVVWLYILLCIGLDVTIWVIPSFVENAIAVSFIGFFMGPIFPILMNRTGQLIPHWLISSSIGVIAGVGQTGSAVLPFLTGAMASKVGIWSLHPLVVSVFTVMLVLWALIPPDPPNNDKDKGDCA